MLYSIEGGEVTKTSDPDQAEFRLVSLDEGNVMHKLDLSFFGRYQHRRVSSRGLPLVSYRRVGPSSTFPAHQVVSR